MKDEAIRAAVEALEEFDHSLTQWAQAYPLTAFPKPDLIKAAQVLRDAGMTLDGVSADCMRHVVTKLDELFQPVRIARDWLLREAQGEERDAEVATWNAALEAAAKACDERSRSGPESMTAEAMLCAAAIRSMKKDEE
jgi:hypothetical protein